jgi:hypothetical protein
MNRIEEPGPGSGSFDFLKKYGNSGRKNGKKLEI